MCSLNFSLNRNVQWEEQDLKVTEFHLVPTFHSEEQVFGVDPGTTHLGLASIWKESCIAYEIEIPRLQSAPQRILQMQHILSRIFFYHSYSPIAVIEGASFADKYRQVELAEIRAAAVVWFLGCGSKIDNILLYPPQTIRKQIFGSAKIKAHEAWDFLPSNAAAALSCCTMKIKT